MRAPHYLFWFLHYFPHVILHCTIIRFALQQYLVAQDLGGIFLSEICNGRNLRRHRPLPVEAYLAGIIQILWRLQRFDLTFDGFFA